ncbi:hypothetical protein DICPUDRAFT_44415 [Dictyostelium purpureum]|uniref:Uncharacterized protein n=1 Tax=Dictyostelium purpureum TaxID=5786 RepID=F1A671_DICPU|nr:uncharacterized protein DICPUDRAFT_44415 [Dictyostelium purpureum]EGC28309.1 hypothetical protein DICPUDRAFT_44415 [Dictyostelium purpureum]|eukprot:XP_003295164.1 hypothetical protein DICPUDRAFT_44415 [Dictyostelium purpureum]
MKSLNIIKNFIRNNNNSNSIRFFSSNINIVVNSRGIKYIYNEINKKLKNSNNRQISEGSELESRVLISHVLDIDSSAITLFSKKNQHRFLTNEEYSRLQELVNRRLLNEPISYLIGYRYFWKHKFHCDRSTLIPRPDSETIVEKILEEKNKNNLKFDRVLDLGTGTGCLLLSILYELDGSFGVGIDKSKESLLLANKNAKELELKDRVCFLNSDWNHQESLVKELGQFKPFDLVISNPPYISIDEYKELNETVKDWEPTTALIADENGLKDYRNIGLLLKNNKELLSNNAQVVFEIGKGQENDIIEIMESCGFKFTDSKKDLSSIIRCLVFTRNKENENK